MLSKLELNRNKWIKMFGISLSKSKENMIIKIKKKKNQEMSILSDTGFAFFQKQI